MKEYTGGPAFPSSSRFYGHDLLGMSLRDWFAGQALPAVIEKVVMDKHHPDISRVVKLSYEIADVMLLRRSGEWDT